MKEFYKKAHRSFLAVSKTASLVIVLLLIFISSIFAIGCHRGAGQLPFIYGESDWQRMGLQGNVNSLKLYELSWEEAFGRITVKSPTTIDQSTTFSEMGNQTESIYYDSNGQPDWKDIFIYDSTGDIWLETISYEYIKGDSSTVSPQWSYTNMYDEDDRLYSVEGYDYDSDGQKVSLTSWVHLYRYLYDEGKIEHSSYDSDGSLQWKNITEYDGNGRESVSTHYDNRGIMQWSDRFMYDSKGNKTEWYRYDPKGTLQWRDVFKYDDSGNEIECSNYDYRNILEWKDIYIYISEDDLENLNINTIADIKNKYDSHGNWTVKVTLEEREGFGSSYFKVKEIQKRLITYFP